MGALMFKELCFLKNQRKKINGSIISSIICVILLFIYGKKVILLFPIIASCILGYALLIQIIETSMRYEKKNKMLMKNISFCNVYKVIIWKIVVGLIIAFASEICSYFLVSSILIKFYNVQLHFEWVIVDIMLLICTSIFLAVLIAIIYLVMESSTFNNILRGIMSALLLFMTVNYHHGKIGITSIMLGVIGFMVVAYCFLKSLNYVTINY